MLQIIQSFSLELTFLLSLVLVIIPTGIFITLRRKLYQQLKAAANTVKNRAENLNQFSTPTRIQTSKIELGNIIEELYGRFIKASEQLDTVNTSALVEWVYSESTFNFWDRDLRCEKWEYFSRVLPNLLLAFGLLGTFLGITLNLTTISGVISQSGADTNSLVDSLQSPLKSMGIAFITSLIALICSSLLTVVNLCFNTGMMKNYLLSQLEHYLDNIIHLNPTSQQGENRSRLDTEVKGINSNLRDLVAYQREFLDRFNDNFKEVLEKTLQTVANQIAQENAKTNQLAREVYQELNKSVVTISAGAVTFFQAAETIKSSQFADKLATVTANLDQSTAWLRNIIEEYITNLKETKSELSNLVETVKQNQLAANTELNTVGDKLVTTLETQLGTHTGKLQEISANLEQYMSHFINTEAELSNLVSIAKSSQIENNSELQNLVNSVNSLSSSMTNQLTKDLQKIREQLAAIVEIQFKNHSEESQKMIELLTNYQSGKFNNYQALIESGLVNLSDFLVQENKKNKQHLEQQLSNILSQMPRGIAQELNRGY